MKQRRVRHLPVGERAWWWAWSRVRDLFVLAEAVLRLDPDGADTARECWPRRAGNEQTGTELPRRDE